MLQDTCTLLFFFLRYATGTRVKKVKRETWQRECNLDKKDEREREKERNKKVISKYDIFKSFEKHHYPYSTIV